MSPNARVVGRQVLVWMVAIGLCLAVVADAVVASLADRWAEASVYGSTAALLLLVGYNIERVKLFIEE